MTRKDFELIARTIKRLAGDRNGGQSKETVAEVFADALRVHSGNANFDRAKFLKACGVS